MKLWGWELQSVVGVGNKQNIFCIFFCNLSKWEALLLLGQLASLQMDTYSQELLEEM